MAVGGDGDDDMERDFAARLRLAPSPSSASASPTAAAGGGGIAFRAPQEQFTVDDFDIGKIYGVGSYSKVCSLRTIVPTMCGRSFIYLISGRLLLPSCGFFSWGTGLDWELRLSRFLFLAC
jgi:hypothetical protein